jgi:large subunit ribosomal protein L25
MKVVTIDTKPRPKSGSREARKLRAEGRIPCVVYGMGKPTEHISVPTSDFTHEASRGHRMFDLSLEGGMQVALVKEILYNHLGDRVEHVDFARIDRNKPVRVYVPLEFVGRPKEAAHAILEHLLEDIEIECLPEQIPEHIEVIVSDLDVGQTITAGQVKLPPGAKLADPSKSGYIVVNYYIRHVKEEVAAPVAGEELKEPEVIEKGKKVEEEEGEAEPPAKK